MKTLLIRDFPELSYARAEAMNTLCVNLTFSGQGIRKIMVTSSHAAEGKSSLSMNILRTLSGMGFRVVLVDADLRRSAINYDFRLYCEGERRLKGLADFLAGHNALEDVLYETNLPNAFIVPVGRLLSNPLPLLNSERMNELLIEMAGRMDYVIVDAPPVGTVIDGAQIAKLCDGVLLAVCYNAVRRRELVETKAQLDQTGCPILGTVLTMVRYDNYISKRYYYKSYYTEYAQDARREKRNRRQSKREALLEREKQAK